MECMRGWSLRMKVALDAVVDESCEAGCDYYAGKTR